MNLIDFINTFAPTAAGLIQQKIKEFEAKYPDATDALESVLSEIGVAFTPQALAGPLGDAIAEVGGIKGGFRPVHHASDGGA